MNCARCSIEIIPDQRWRPLPAAERIGKRYHRARGLCCVCYDAAVADDTLLDYERRTMPVDFLMDEIEHLMTDGENTFEGLARRLGMKRDTLSRNLFRAARRGDERAIALRSRLPIRKAA